MIYFYLKNSHSYGEVSLSLALAKEMIASIDHAVYLKSSQCYQNVLGWIFFFTMKTVLKTGDCISDRIFWVLNSPSVFSNWHKVQLRFYLFYVFAYFLTLSFVLIFFFFWIVGTKGRLPQKQSLLHKDYFELKAIKTQQIEEKLFTSPWPPLPNCLK